LLTAVLPEMVLATFAAWIGRTLVTKRLAQHAPPRPRPAAGDPRQWADFERASWPYAEATSDALRTAG
jgi:hypothetical protein